MLDWIDDRQWTRGALARNSDGVGTQEVKDKDGRTHVIPLSPNDPSAESWDLYGALRISIYDDDVFEEAVQDLKKAFKTRFPEKWAKHEGKNYYKKDGQIVMLDPFLHQLNDELDSFEEVKRLLFYI